MKAKFPFSTLHSNANIRFQGVKQHTFPLGSASPLNMSIASIGIHTLLALYLPLWKTAKEWKVCKKHSCGNIIYQFIDPI